VIVKSHLLYWHLYLYLFKFFLYLPFQGSSFIILLDSCASFLSVTFSHGDSQVTVTFQLSGLSFFFSFSASPRRILKKL